MSARNFVIPAGEGAVWQMAPGRSATLKITSEIAQSVMMFEEIAPRDTVTDLHIHHDSDEVAFGSTTRSTEGYVPEPPGHLQFARSSRGLVSSEGLQG